MAETPDTKDLRQIGVSTAGQKILDAMDSAGLVNEQMDAYRLALATAISFGRRPRTSDRSWKTKYSVGGIDPNQDLKVIVSEVYPDFAGTPYRAIQDLADQGLEILAERMEGGTIFFGELVEKIENANRQPSSDEAAE